MRMPLVVLTFMFVLCYVTMIGGVWTKAGLRGPNRVELQQRGGAIGWGKL